MAQSVVRDPLWSAPPPHWDWSLPDGQIHLWHGSLDTYAVDAAQLAETLSPEERERAARYPIARSHHRFIVGRALLRLLLGNYLAVEPHHVPLSTTAYGKPVLAGGEGLTFTLSHKEGLVLYAVTRHRALGVDLEQTRLREEASLIMAEFCTTRELQLYHALPVDQQEYAFCRAWVAKEALGKARSGKGTRHFADCEVQLNPKQPPRFLSIGGSSAAAEKWSLYEMNPAPGHIAALAVGVEAGRNERNEQLHCWSLHLVPERLVVARSTQTVQAAAMDE